jgi:spiro-SPASM protein
MNALAVLYGGDLAEEAFEDVFSGKNALSLALEGAAAFPGVRQVCLLAGDEPLPPSLSEEGVRPVRAPEGRWTRKSLLSALAELSRGFDCTYFAWADCPLLDPVLTEALAERHRRFAAEYSYADGWPYGFAPELLAPGIPAVLAKINGDEDGPVERDALFSVIQKDINAFDIETEISPADLRPYRLSLTADSKRNLLLLTRLTGAGLSRAAEAEQVLVSRPELLRTLPVFYAVQAAGPCPQACELCPYPRFGVRQYGIPVTERKDFLDPARFEELLDKIAAFSGDGVIDLSLWGELALHPQKELLIGMILSRPELSAVVETSGLGWKPRDLDALAEAAAGAARRKNRMAPLSWIVSLDSADPGIYKKIRGPGYAEAVECARTLMGLFPRDTYVQAVRTKGDEDAVEQFYRSWKEASPRGGAQIIIQKYDNFCGFLPDLRASDLSPVKRRPCWHLIRDMAVLIDGRVPVCKEDVAAGGDSILGNVFTEALEVIWSRGEGRYREQCALRGGPVYKGICADCDEYYTYNF